jgi:nucleotide-binding universal stress UspA family protein
LFSKVLIPVDGSDNSHRALDTALYLSQKLGAKVAVIHVMEDIPVLHIQSEKLLRELLDAYKKESQLILSKCSEIATSKGLLTNTKLLQGNAGSTMLDFCEKLYASILYLLIQSKIKPIVSFEGKNNWP